MTPDRADPPVSFDEWARISARLLRRDADERFEVLDDEDLDPDAWDAVDLYWVSVLAREVGRADLTRARRYSQACGAELASRPAQPPAGEQRSTSLDETAIGTALPDETALPFDARAPVVVPPPADQTGVDLGGETAAVRALDIEDDPLPFVPAMSIEHYAALCAKIALYPSHVDEIRERYGLSSARALESAHASFRRRFDADRALKMRFQELEAHYRAYLSGTAHEGPHG